LVVITEEEVEAAYVLDTDDDEFWIICLVLVIGLISRAALFVLGTTTTLLFLLFCFWVRLVLVLVVGRGEVVAVAVAVVVVVAVAGAVVLSL